ncbi:MAG: hypothetical protein EXS50_00245 [Candidatus Taylorbacteria bacterium]|nr:hypothetical protein [Candidatus Taylorbacteria bacterium]
MKEKIRQNWLVIFIVLVFFVSRFFVFGQMYHQDEYKWATIVNPSFGLELESNHPPLVSIIYRIAGDIFGFDHLRVVPIVFGTGVLILTYLLTRRLYGRRAALWTLLLLTISIFNFIATTQIDIDGALLPFVGLLTIYAYYKIDFTRIRGRENYRWYVLGVLAIIAGLLIKLSFVLVLITLATEFFITHPSRRKLLWYASGILVGVLAVVAVIVLLVVKLFHITGGAQFIEYISHFSILNFTSRNYGQVLFLSVKGIVLASPLLLLWYFIVLTKKEYLIKFRFWLIFLLYNFLFYYIIFDFTNRTIERYLMFLIIPSAMIAGSLIAERSLTAGKDLVARILAWVVVCAGATYLYLNKSYEILPLNPKSAYIDHFKHFDLNFLIPITGGSGPIGFYMSVSYIFFFFLISTVAIIVYRYVKSDEIKTNAFLAVLVIGFMYNAVLDRELISGKMYGSVDRVAKEIMTEVVKNSNIKKITTYYDIGGYELNISDKYGKRFYTDPMFAKTNVGKFLNNSNNKENYYAVVDFPLIDTNSVYWKYLESCKKIKEAQDKKIKGYIFDCLSGDTSLFSKK